jgi:hypothetical protein
MIPAAKAGHVQLFVCPQGMELKNGRQFGQIEKHEKQAVLKNIRPRPEAPMTDGPFVYAALHMSNSVVSFLKCLDCLERRN